MSAVMSAAKLPLVLFNYVRDYPVEGSDFARHYAEVLEASAAARLALLPHVQEDLNLQEALLSYSEAAVGEAVTALAGRLLSDTDVIQQVNQHLTQAIQTQSLTSARWVLEQSRAVYERCAQLAFIKDAEGRLVLGPFAPAPALKALELIGKHVDVQAFKEVVEVQGGEDLARVLDMARKRAEGRVIDVTPERDEESVGEIPELEDLLGD
jgi:phage terminase small subunit